MNKTGYLIVPAVQEDADRLAGLETELFQTDQCSKRSFRHLIRKNHVVVVRKEESAEIIGYAILLGRKNSRKMRIYSFGIAKTARGAGLAEKLLKALEDIARKKRCSMLTLEVSDNNVAALGLYRKHGFSQHGFRLGYYEDGGHAILMSKKIEGVSTNDDHRMHESSLHK